MIDRTTLEKMDMTDPKWNNHFFKISSLNEIFLSCLTSYSCQIQRRYQGMRSTIENDIFFYFDNGLFHFCIRDDTRILYYALPGYENKFIYLTIHIMMDILNI